MGSLNMALRFVSGSPGMLRTAPPIALVIWIVLGVMSWTIKSRQLKNVAPEKTASLILEKLGWLVGSVQTLRPVAGIRGEESEHIVVVGVAASQSR